MEVIGVGRKGGEGGEGEVQCLEEVLDVRYLAWMEGVYGIAFGLYPALISALDVYHGVGIPIGSYFAQRCYIYQRIHTSSQYPVLIAFCYHLS